MDRKVRSGNGSGGGTNRRGRMVGTVHPRLAADAAEEPQCDGGYAGSSGFHWHPRYEPPLPAFQRARRAILTAMSQEEYMRAYLGEEVSLWNPQPGYLREVRSCTTKRVETSSRARASSMPPSVCSRRAACPLSERAITSSWVQSTPLSFSRGTFPGDLRPLA